MTEDDVLHSVGNYWISNEGTKKEPSFHVWATGITHSTCDSAYASLSLAICRAEYLNKTIPKPYLNYATNIRK